MACDQNYLVRVTTMPPDTSSGVFIYTNTSPSTLVTSLSIKKVQTLCFTEDPQSTVKNLVIGIDSCSVCGTPSWNTTTPPFMSVSVNPPGGGNNIQLVLKAVAGPTTYDAAYNNMPGQINGGRPIIRYPTFDYGVLIIALVITALILGYIGVKAWRNQAPSVP